jgi:hypothetical protein
VCATAAALEVDGGRGRRQLHVAGTIRGGAGDGTGDGGGAGGVVGGVRGGVGAAREGGAGGEGGGAVGSLFSASAARIAAIFFSCSTRDARRRTRRSVPACGRRRVIACSPGTNRAMFDGRLLIRASTIHAVSSPGARAWCARTYATGAVIE